MHSSFIRFVFRLASIQLQSLSNDFHLVRFGFHISWLSGTLFFFVSVTSPHIYSTFHFSLSSSTSRPNQWCGWPGVHALPVTWASSSGLDINMANVRPLYCVFLFSFFILRNMFYHDGHYAVTFAPNGLWMAVFCSSHSFSLNLSLSPSCLIQVHTPTPGAGNPVFMHCQWPGHPVVGLISTCLVFVHSTEFFLVSFVFGNMFYHNGHYAVTFALNGLWWQVSVPLIHFLSLSLFIRPVWSKFTPQPPVRVAGVHALSLPVTWASSSGLDINMPCVRPLYCFSFSLSLCLSLSLSMKILMYILFGYWVSVPHIHFVSLFRRPVWSKFTPQCRWPGGWVQRLVQVPQHWIQMNMSTHTHVPLPVMGH